MPTSDKLTRANGFVLHHRTCNAIAWRTAAASAFRVAPEEAQKYST